MSFIRKLYKKMRIFVLVKVLRSIGEAKYAGGDWVKITTRIIFDGRLLGYVTGVELDKRSFGGLVWRYRVRITQSESNEIIPGDSVSVDEKWLSRAYNKLVHKSHIIRREDDA